MIGRFSPHLACSSTLRAGGYRPGSRPSPSRKLKHSSPLRKFILSESLLLTVPIGPYRRLIVHNAASTANCFGVGVSASDILKTL
jgi:hypothetical protein